jgi:hypothetical protein
MNDLSCSCIRASISTVCNKHVKADWYKPFSKRKIVSVAHIPNNTERYRGIMAIPRDTEQYRAGLGIHLGIPDTEQGVACTYRIPTNALGTQPYQKYLSFYKISNTEGRYTSTCCYEIIIVTKNTNNNYHRFVHIKHLLRCVVDGYDREWVVCSDCII